MTDLWVLILPLPILWRLRMTPLKKFSTVFIFCLGLFIIATSKSRIDALIHSEIIDFNRHYLDDRISRGRQYWQRFNVVKQPDIYLEPYRGFSRFHRWGLWHREFRMRSENADLFQQQHVYPFWELQSHASYQSGLLGLQEISLENRLHTESIFSQINAGVANSIKP